MKYVVGLIGLLAIFLLAWVASNNRSKIKYRPILILLALQFLFAFALLNSKTGNLVISAIGGGFEQLLKYAGEGVNFVFGNLLNEGSFSFFIFVLLPIVFISALIGILKYCRVLDIIIQAIGLCLSKVNGMGRLESYNAVASAILGQSEVFISIKKQLPILPEHRLYTLCTSAMSTVSMSIVGAYMQLLQPAFVVTAIVLNLLGGFIIASIINPYTLTEQEDMLEIDESQQEKQSFFEVLCEYILDGFKVAVIVAAMLIGFIALIAMINGIFESIFSVSFQRTLGYLFSPFAFLIGIPWSEAVDAGTIMATKIVSNEFVAMETLKEGIKNQSFQFSEHSIAVLSVFLVSFANFASIGIIAGAIKALDNRQGNVVSKFGLKLLYGAILVSLLNGAIVSLVYIV